MSILVTGGAGYIGSHTVVELLNTEASSPLKGKIIMGAEKITGGFKAEQIINGENVSIETKSKVDRLHTNNLHKFNIPVYERRK